MAKAPAPKGDAPRLNAAIRKAFLAHLAETANVSASARIAGISGGAAYAERRRLPAFLTDWHEALAEGYTHFEIGDEGGDMQSFDDVTFPLEIGREAMATAEFSTNIVTTISGHERRNSSWADARLSYDVGPGVRSESELGILLDFFRARRGPAIGFRFTDPFDHSSNAMTGDPTMLDQHLGVGDGLKSGFPLFKTYGSDGQIRRITRPQEDSLSIALNGVAATGWSLAEGGVVEFETAPAAGAVINAGYRFDVPVRFADDRIEVARATFGAGDMPSVSLIEIKEAV